MITWALFWQCKKGGATITSYSESFAELPPIVWLQGLGVASDGCLLRGMWLTKQVASGKRPGVTPQQTGSKESKKRRVEVFSQSEVKKANARLTSPARKRDRGEKRAAPAQS